MWYEILGIEETNDEKIIKKAYANLIKDFHVEDDQEGFMRIKEAYETGINVAKAHENLAFDFEDKTVENEQTVYEEQLVFDKKPYDEFDEDYNSDMVRIREIIINNILYNPNNEKAWYAVLKSDKVVPLFTSPGSIKALLNFLDSFDFQNTHYRIRKQTIIPALNYLKESNEYAKKNKDILNEIIERASVKRHHTFIQNGHFDTASFWDFKDRLINSDSFIVKISLKMFYSFLIVMIITGITFFLVLISD